MTSASTPDGMGEAGAARQFLRLALGPQSFATPIHRVREILEVCRLTELPCTPSFVRGVMHLRGVVVPVMDLNARLGRGVSTLGPRSCVLVVESGDAASGAPVLGALVDGVHEVLELGDEQIEPPPPLGTPVPAEYLRGMAHVRGALMGVLDLDRLLSPDALATLIEEHASA